MLLVQLLSILTSWRFAANLKLGERATVFMEGLPQMRSDWARQKKAPSKTGKRGRR
jgi:hypothetical protein